MSSWHISGPFSQGLEFTVSARGAHLVAMHPKAVILTLSFVDPAQGGLSVSAQIRAQPRDIRSLKRPFSREIVDFLA